MAWRRPAVACHLLEVTLISAQGLGPLSRLPVAASTRRPPRMYAVVWVGGSVKLRTPVDRVGGENPTWNEKFLFRVPAGFLADDSCSVLRIQIYTAGFLADSLVGTADFLVSKQRLLSRPLGQPSFAAVGVRRPSGRFHGVLNLGTAIMPPHCVPPMASGELLCPGVGAVSFQALMGDNMPVPRIGGFWHRLLHLKASPTFLRQKLSEQSTVPAQVREERRV